MKYIFLCICLACCAGGGLRYRQEYIVEKAIIDEGPTQQQRVEALYKQAKELSDQGYLLKNSDRKESGIRATQALDTFDQALNIQPDHLGSLLYKAITHYDMGEYQLSYEQLVLLLEKYPDTTEALFYKAKNLIELGKKEEAKEIFFTILDIDPEFSYATLELAALEQGNNDE